MNIDGIQTSRITLDNIHLLNHQTHCYARTVNCVGKEYTVGEFVLGGEKYFKNDPWKYSVNRYGFRGPNWDFKKRIALFGCSNVFGIGVEKDTSEIMTEKLNEQVINFGIPGAGPIHVMKAFCAFARLHPISHAFISLPPAHRIFLPESPRTANGHDIWIWQNRFAHEYESDKKFIKQLYNVWNNDVIISYMLDMIDYTITLAESKNITLYWTTWDNPMKFENNDSYFDLKKVVDNYYEWPNLQEDFARDGGHPGPTVLRNYAENCLACL